MSKKVLIDKSNDLHFQLERDIAERVGIPLTLYYADIIRVKEGFWETSAKSRDEDMKYKIVGERQVKEGYSKRYPGLVTVKNETNSVEITFKRKPFEWEMFQDFERIAKNIPPSPYSRRKIMFNPGSGNAFELSTFDAHFGKLAAEIETGYRNYDLKITRDDYQWVADQLINDAIPWEPELCVMPIGQDIFHIDNMEGKTTHGSHAMDVDGRITKVADVIFYAVIDVILRLRKLSKVLILWTPGNHDHFASYMLCFAIAQYFRNDPMITVDLDLPARGKEIHKRVLWGKTLVGFTHRIVNRQSNWVNELAQAFPKEWAESVFREWHFGDQHKKQTTKMYPHFTMGGVNLRQLTALSPVDKWHTENLFTDAVPGGEGFIWNKDRGVIVNLMAWTGQYEQNRNETINKY